MEIDHAFFLFCGRKFVEAEWIKLSPTYRIAAPIYSGSVV